MSDNAEVITAKTNQTFATVFQPVPTYRIVVVVVSLGRVERTKPQLLYFHSGYAEACRTNKIHFNRL